MKFCSDAIGLVFLLNRRYAPFYKWLHRAVRDLPLWARMSTPASPPSWTPEACQKADLMEAISVLLERSSVGKVFPIRRATFFLTTRRG